MQRRRSARRSLAAVCAAAGVLACATVACATAASAEEPAGRLTLDQALAIALQGNRRIEIESLQVSQAERQLAAARTRRYPVLDLDVMASSLLSPIELGFERGVFGDFPGIGPVPEEDTQVTSDPSFDWFLTASVSQPITQQRRIGLGVKTAEMNIDVQRERLRLARQDVANEVRQSYNTILQAESARRAAEEAARFFTELERVVASQVARETALAGDLLDVRSRLLGAQYQLRVAGHSADAAKERLNLLLGRDVSILFETEPLPPPVLMETDLETAVSKALANRPDVREARLLARTAGLDLTMKRSEYIPDLSFVVSNYSLNVEFLPRNIQTVGLALSWEPFDWGRKRHEAAEKVLIKNQSDRSVSEIESSVRVEVGARFRDVEDSRALVEVREAEKAALVEKARVMANRYEQRAALLTDVLESQSNLAQAEDQRQQALLAFWSARASFLKAVGEE